MSLISRNKIREALRLEMEKRGYTFVESGGDLAVGASVIIEERIEYVTDPQMHHHMGMGMGGMGMMGLGMGWGMGGMGTGMMGPGMGMGMGMGTT